MTFENWIRPGYNRDFPEISEKGIDQVTIMYLRNELPDYTMKLSGFWIDLPAEWQWIAQVRIGYCIPRIPGMEDSFVIELREASFTPVSKNWSKI